MEIGVTGATGQLGGRVARRLATAGLTQRLLVRDPSRAPELPGARVVRCAFDDVPAGALEGLDVLLVVSASESADRLRQHLSVVDSAAAAGVGHVVYTSFLGAAPDATFTLARDHWATEQHLLASGMRTTLVRDSFYADVLPDFVDEHGVLAGPAGDGRGAPVTRDDVADCLAAVLAAPAEHVGASYALTGPEALTLTEVAQVMTAVTGRDVSFEDQTLEQARASRGHHGVQEWQLQAWISTYTAIRAGELDVVTRDVERLTGRPATSLEAWLRSRG